MVRDFTLDRGSYPVLPETLFGIDMEHTRSCVSGGLSAQMLRNRKFAGRPGQYGVAAEWKAFGGRALYYVELGWGETFAYTRHYAESAMNRINELQAQSIENLTEGVSCGITQDGLYLRAGGKYVFAAVASVKKPVTLSVVISDANGNILAENKLDFDQEQYERRECKLTSPVTIEDARITISFSARTLVRLGALSLLPEKHFHGMREDTVAELKNLHPSLIRWPGGNFAGEYRWTDMFLPVDERGPLQSCMENETQPYTHGYDNHEIDTDGIAALCREVGAEPYLTINLAWTTPEESAAWVEYCNGDVSTKYGRMRAERGHPEPYHVKYWSLGNEMGYSHMEGTASARAYAEEAKKHALAMLEKDSGLILCSSGPYPNREWAEEAAANLLPECRLVSYHQYHNIPIGYAEDDCVDRVLSSLMEAIDRTRENTRSLRAMLPKEAEISLDEWNCWGAWFRAGNTVEGLYTAAMLHLIMEESAPLAMPVACHFQAVNEGLVEVYPGESRLTAQGEAFSLLSAHRGGKSVKIGGAEPLEAIATEKDGILTLTVLNTENQEKNCRIRTDGEAAGLLCLTASDPYPFGHFEQSAPAVVHAGEELCFTMPGHSVCRLKLRLSGEDRS